MYWYIKYPLVVILALACLGLTGLLLRSCRRTAPEPTPAQATAQEGPQAPLPAATAPGEAAPGTEGTMSARPAPVPPASRTPIGVEERLAAARRQFDLGMLEAARKLARQAMKMEGVVEFDPTWRRCVEIIDDVDRRLMNSSAPAKEKAPPLRTAFSWLGVMVSLGSLSKRLSTGRRYPSGSWLSSRACRGTA